MSVATIRREYEEITLKILAMRPDLNRSEIIEQVNILSKPTLSSMCNILNECVRNAAAGEPMPWELTIENDPTCPGGQAFIDWVESWTLEPMK